MPLSRHSDPADLVSRTGLHIRRAGGVEVIRGPESHENGKFAWIMDPEGNKVELWEPMIWDERNKSA